ncbi:hypothetical protein ACQP2F_25060 [Actinoplanes sp. CA-030573]|uniref:hypothetical protein n=1 Tax=Actinoplanes sp. CA-030573 TaxID=3239898 RepID=UPI003D900534
MTLEAGPVVEADLSAYVLTLLDDHLAAMREIRNRLTAPGRVSPGDRRILALESIAIAERYADRMTSALGGRTPMP